MKTILTKSEHSFITTLVEKTIKSGKRWESDDMHHPAGAIIDAVLSIKGMEKQQDPDSSNGEGFETNGWSYDWWQKFVYKGKYYTLSGSGYYGGHSFGLSDE